MVFSKLLKFRVRALWSNISDVACLTTYTLYIKQDNDYTALFCSLHGCVIVSSVKSDCTLSDANSFQILWYNLRS